MFYLACNYIRLDHDGEPLRGRPNSDGFFDTEEQAMHAAIKAARLHDQYVYVIRESDGERVGEVAP